MNPAVRRLRMFAGPNGSGKSTIKSVIDPDLLGFYVNADDIEQDISLNGFLDVAKYGISPSIEEILDFFRNSPLFASTVTPDLLDNLRYEAGRLYFPGIKINSYIASAISDFLRQKLLSADKTFTFETVMSHQSKIDFLRKAQEKGFRTYLYYVATEDPDINIVRVRNRETIGGHSVPTEKIIERYYRSLNYLTDAIQYTNRAYIFDNSSHEKVWIAEITNGEELEMKTDRMPAWFKTALWDKWEMPL